MAKSKVTRRKRLLPLKKRHRFHKKKKEKEKIVTPPTTTTKLKRVDVLLGRGSGVAQHIGNALFRRLVDEHRPRYRQSPRSQKTMISKFVVEQVRKLGGRFLEAIETRSDSSSHKHRYSSTEDSNHDSDSDTEEDEHEHEHEPQQDQEPRLSLPSNNKLRKRSSNKKRVLYEIVSDERAFTKTAQALRERDVSSVRDTKIRQALDTTTTTGALLPRPVTDPAWWSQIPEACALKIKFQVFYSQEQPGTTTISGTSSSTSTTDPSKISGAVILGDNSRLSPPPQDSQKQEGPGPRQATRSSNQKRVNYYRFEEWQEDPVQELQATTKECTTPPPKASTKSSQCKPSSSWSKSRASSSSRVSKKQGEGNKKKKGNNTFSIEHDLPFKKPSKKRKAPPQQPMQMTTPRKPSSTTVSPYSQASAARYKQQQPQQQQQHSSRVLQEIAVPTSGAGNTTGTVLLPCSSTRRQYQLPFSTPNVVVPSTRSHPFQNQQATVTPCVGPTSPSLAGTTTATATTASTRTAFQYYQRPIPVWNSSDHHQPRQHTIVHSNDNNNNNNNNACMVCATAPVGSHIDCVCHTTFFSLSAPSSPWSIVDGSTGSIGGDGNQHTFSHGGRPNSREASPSPMKMFASVFHHQSVGVGATDNSTPPSKASSSLVPSSTTIPNRTEDDCSISPISVSSPLKPWPLLGTTVEPANLPNKTLGTPRPVRIAVGREPPASQGSRDDMAAAVGAETKDQLGTGQGNRILLLQASPIQCKENLEKEQGDTGNSNNRDDSSAKRLIQFVVNAPTSTPVTTSPMEISTKASSSPPAAGDPVAVLQPFLRVPRRVSDINAHSQECPMPPPPRPDMLNASIGPNRSGSNPMDGDDTTILPQKEFSIEPSPSRRISDASHVSYTEPASSDDANNLEVGDKDPAVQDPTFQQDPQHHQSPPSFRSHSSTRCKLFL